MKDNNSYSKTDSLKNSNYSNLPPLATLVTTLVLTLFFWHQFDESLRARSAAVYSEKTGEISNQILKRLHDHEQVLRGAAGLFSVKDTVTRTDWRRYVSALQLDKNQPGILGIGFSKWLPAAEKNTHMQQIRSDGFPEYTIRPAGERPVYTSVIFLEPFNWRNQRAFGYDMYTEQVRKSALDRARDENIATIAAKIILVQETDKDKQCGMLLFVPVYRQGARLDTVGNRREAFTGFVYSPIRMNDFVSGTLARPPLDIAFDINVIGGKTTDTLMYSSMEARRLILPGKFIPAITSVKTAEAYGCSWQFTFKTLPGFNKELNRDKSRLVLYAGIAFSILLAYMVLLIIRNRNQALKYAEEKLFMANDQLSSVVESSGDIIAMMDTEYRYTFFNAAFRNEFQKIFGKELKQGDSMIQALEHLPQELANAREYWNRALGGEDYVICRQFGDTKLIRNWYELHFSPVHASDGEVMGAVHIVRDVTERKRSEEQLNALSTEKSIILDTAGIGISFVRNRRQKWANHTFCELFGYKQEEMEGSETSTHFPSREEYDRFTAEAYPVLASGKTFSKSLQMSQRDGKLFHARFTGKAVNPEQLFEGTIWILSDETVQKELEIKLQQSHLLLTTLSRQVPGTIYQYQLFPDGRSCFPYCSDAIFEMYEVTPEEVREDATPALANIHPDDIAGVVQSIMKSAQTLEPWEYDYRVNLPQKGMRWRHGFSHPQKMADNSTIWHGFIHDSTEQKKLENELIDARNAAEAANLAKSRFLANMSHEIRTPMNGVLGMAQLLAMTELSSEQQAYVETLRCSGKNLLALISDILDLSKIEAGKIELEEGAFDLLAEVKGSVSLLALQAREKGLELLTPVAPSLPNRLRGDAGRLRQILINLMGNALKFTNKGSVTLEIRKEREDKGTVTLRFLIVDTGIGISAEKLETIFAPFTQADGSTTRSHGGTGLGLTISRQLAELMGGSMGVESLPGKGSTFWFTATLKKQQSVHDSVPSGPKKLATPRPMMERSAESNFHRGATRLLLVEDEPINQMLMDCMMPLLNGHEATAVIRDPGSAVKNHLIPVIALTANAFTSDQEFCLAAGMNDYMSKPIEIIELLEMIEKWAPFDGQVGTKQEGPSQRQWNADQI